MSFQEFLLRNLMATCKRKNLEPYLIYTNLTPNESRPKPKTQNYKTFKEKHRGKYSWHWIIQRFLKYDIEITGGKK